MICIYSRMYALSLSLSLTHTHTNKHMFTIQAHFGWGFSKFVHKVHDLLLQRRNVLYVFRNVYTHTLIGL